jgi:ABC-type amino acid transport substrate-binding protein
MRALLLLLCASCASAPAAPAATDAGADTVVDAALAPQSLEAQVADVQAPFDVAHYGVSDGMLHVEAHYGAAPGCPTMTSPTPDRTVVIAGLRASFAAPQTYADGVRVSLLDFKGTLTKEPILRATEVVVSAPATRPDVVSFYLDATIPGGKIQGTVTATHCASLD